jgi:hypothetical protein
VSHEDCSFTPPTSTVGVGSWKNTAQSGLESAGEHTVYTHGCRQWPEHYGIRVVSGLRRQAMWQDSSSNKSSAPGRTWTYPFVPPLMSRRPTQPSRSLWISCWANSSIGWTWPRGLFAINPLAALLISLIPNTINPRSVSETSHKQHLSIKIERRTLLLHGPNNPAPGYHPLPRDP